MKKKVLALTLVFILFINATASAAYSDTVGRGIYSDWDEVSLKHREAVLDLSIHSDGLNVFQGSGGKFEPKGTFTKAYVISLVAVVKVGGNPNKLDLNTLFAADYAREQRFPDVPKTHWANGAINYAYRVGIVEGDDTTGLFEPDTPVTVNIVNAMLISLLGVEPNDRNGVDWIARTDNIMRIYDIKLDDAVENYYPTREEVASMLYAAVNTPMLSRNNNGTYSKQNITLKESAFNKAVEEQTVTITGKVIGTKYASLNEVNNYNRSVLIEGVGVNDGKPNMTVFRFETPDDDVVPVALLGRVVELKAVKVNEGLYRAASGAKAEPVYTTDVVSLPMYNDGTLNKVLYDAACAEIPRTPSNTLYTGVGVHSEQMRGAYTNYGFGGGYNKNNKWDSIGNWSYAYAVTYGNTNYYNEVFYLNYRALTVTEIYNDGTVTFRGLDGITPVSVNNAKVDTFEYGTTLKKGDIIVAVVDAKNNIVTAEKVNSKTGVKRGNIFASGILIDGVAYNTWNDMIKYTERQMAGSWAAGIQNWTQFNNYITYWAFSPVYGEYTNAETRIFHTSAPGDIRERWFEWNNEFPSQSESYCMLINVVPGTVTTNAVITIVAANNRDSGTYKLNELYVRDVKSSWLGNDALMYGNLLDKPIKGIGLGAHAGKGITLKNKVDAAGVITEKRTDVADGLFWWNEKMFGVHFTPHDPIISLSGINIYGYKLLPNGQIDLYELNAGIDSGLEVIRAKVSQSQVMPGNKLEVNGGLDDKGIPFNQLLFAGGKTSGYWDETNDETWMFSDGFLPTKRTLDTKGAVWFTFSSGKHKTEAKEIGDLYELSNWKVNNPKEPYEDGSILIYTIKDEVMFIVYEESYNF
ncbi:MAG: S-layer homology domain-containing protein [Oscillospiraceae bacterium]|nr:S-layer homology domain-containing protein [Oscillospiraceae bacterium]